MPPPSLSFYYSYMHELRFLSLIRRFLRSKSKSSRKRLRFPSHPSSDILFPEIEHSIVDDDDQLAASSSSVLQRTVKSLHFGDGDEKERAAKEIERLIKKESGNSKVRKLIVDLGVIPVEVKLI
ncbi:uncharacterized protein LOC127144499 [Cucumis melo]|uniref:Uncharacterized protein LOC127144499 n=1 Tax=Cucumis melo TaxID=3656 RepID=A0ABM3KFH1_CUCME|nr:uncharacterized protein LOC127144499 [Cucumis melo]